MFILLITSINFVINNILIDQDSKTINLEKFEGENELDDLDLDKKKLLTQDICFLNTLPPKTNTTPFITQFSTLEYFRKIPTPPPEV